MTPTERQTKRVIIVTSPKAGSGAGREQIPELVELLQSSEIETVTTTEIEQLKSQLADRPSGECLVVAAGGDGTVALVADNIEPDVPLVPMPFGTENLLARYYGYRNNAAHTHQTIVSGQENQIDAGRANGKLFLVMVTCGFDASVVRDVHLRRKGHITKFSYAWPIIKAAWRYRFPSMQIEVRQDDGDSPSQTFDSRWAMIFNLPMYCGGLTIEPDAIGNDGQMDVIAFERGGMLQGLRYWFGVGTGRHLRWNDVARQRVAQASQIEICSEQRVHYQIDGDYAGRLPVSIQILPKRVRLICPPPNAPC